MIKYTEPAVDPTDDLPDARCTGSLRIVVSYLQTSTRRCPSMGVPSHQIGDIPI